MGPALGDSCGRCALRHPLVSGSRGELEVRLADEPATVVLDARQSGAGGDVRACRRPLLVPGTVGIEGDLGFVGDPAHGVFVHDRDSLVLPRAIRPWTRPSRAS